MMHIIELLALAIAMLVDWACMHRASLLLQQNQAGLQQERLREGGKSMHHHIKLLFDNIVPVNEVYRQKIVIMDSPMELRATVIGTVQCSKVIWEANMRALAYYLVWNHVGIENM